MEQRHISLVRHQIAEGDLVLLHPATLQPGICRFKTSTGKPITLEVVKFTSYKPNK